MRNTAAGRAALNATYICKLLTNKGIMAAAARGEWVRVRVRVRVFGFGLVIRSLPSLPFRFRFRVMQGSVRLFMQSDEWGLI